MQKLHLIYNVNMELLKLKDVTQSAYNSTTS